jgi:hypothetical protein
MSAEKIKYVKQRDKSSCGPIAIINILKWLGHNVTYDFIHIARWVCQWKDARDFGGGGVTARDMEKALKYFGVKKTRKVRPTLEQINNHIDSGGIVLLSYSIPNNSAKSVFPFLPESLFAWGHFSLCIRRTGKSYIMVNDGTTNTVGRRSKDTMKKMIGYEPDGEKCWAWFIEKPKKKRKTKCQKTTK